MTLRGPTETSQAWSFGTPPNVNLTSVSATHSSNVEGPTQSVFSWTISSAGSLTTSSTSRPFVPNQTGSLEMYQSVATPLGYYRG